MLKHRAIRLSLKDRIRDMLLSPDVATGWAAFNIYNESQFRAAQAGSFTPVFPFVYLLDSYILPVAQRLDKQYPQVVIEIETYRSRPFEIGNRSGRDVTAWVHVFGKDRGQRDDLGSYIVDYIGNSLPIKDYSAANPSGVVVDNALFDDEKVAKDMYTPRLEQEVSGSLLMGWTRCEIGFMPKA